MKVGVKSGVFTLLHSGHIWCFQHCSEQVDRLIVLTNDDEYVKNKKGIVPVPLDERLIILSSIRYIDEVHSFSGPTEEIWIKPFAEQRLKQEFGDGAKLIVFHSDELEGQDYVPGQKYADEIRFVPKIKSPVQSSVTRIFEDIQGGKNE
jgi:cytidyltransferase-like protein